jgi:hypothetical protein
MCFTLYAGTTNPLPRKAWDKDARGLSVNSVGERDADVVKHFSCSEVQNIGSTSGCGCDFPHITLTRGEWVGYSDVVVDDPEWEASERENREALVTLLRESGEKTVDLYGVWDGDFAKTLAVTQKRPYVITSKPAIESKRRH